ncbi:hypothetical protein D3C76_545110 [compost metagenome]
MSVLYSVVSLVVFFILTEFIEDKVKSKKTAKRLRIILICGLILFFLFRSINSSLDRISSQGYSTIVIELFVLMIFLFIFCYREQIETRLKRLFDKIFKRNQ